MPEADHTLFRLREICLALPDTTEGTAWRHPVFRVGEKIFCGYEKVRGKMTVGFRIEPAHAEAWEGDPRLVACQNFGKLKWVSVEAAAIEDWEGIGELIRESYRLSVQTRPRAKRQAP